MHVCVSVCVCFCACVSVRHIHYCRDGLCQNTHNSQVSKCPDVVQPTDRHTTFFVRILDDVNRNCKKIKIYQNAHLAETVLNHFVIHNVSTMTKAPVFKDAPCG